MPISALPTPPSATDPTNFPARADAFLGALPTFVTQANALETNVNAKEASAVASATAAGGHAATAQAASIVAAAATAYVATSETPHNLTVGAKVFALNEAGRGFASGQELVAIRRADSSVRLLGTRGAYSGSNLTLNVSSTLGAAGSYTDWIIFPAAWASAPPATKEDAWAGTAGLKSVTPDVLVQADAWVQSHASEVSGGAIVFNGQRGHNRWHSVTATLLVAEPVNLVMGRVYTFDLLNIAGGSYAITFNEKFKFLDAGTPTMPTVANTRLTIYVQKDSAGNLLASYKRSV